MDQQKQIIDLQNEKRAKTVEMESRERQNADNNKTTIAVAMINASVKENIAGLENAVENIAAKIDTQYKMLDGQAQRTHELTTQDLQQGHEAGLAAADMANQQNISGQQQQHEQTMQGADLAAQQQQAEAQPAAE